MFFLLTLVVLFTSSNPFELPAVVAYVSSLSLAIVCGTAPYFIQYFINLHRKMHQIEEAIVLLSQTMETESLNPANALTQKLDPDRSAVSFLEDSNVSPNTQPDANVSNGAMEKKASEDLEDDPDQMSLFKFGAEEVIEAQFSVGEPDVSFDLFEEEPGAEPEPVFLRAFLLLPGNHQLFLRIDEKDIQMDRVDVGKYELSIPDLESETEAYFCLDKKTVSKESVYLIPGSEIEAYPEFEK